MILSLAGLLAISGCSLLADDAALPNDKGVINLDNPIRRSQTGEVTAEGHATTARLIEALVNGGMVVDEETSYQTWDTCTAYRGEFTMGYQPQNGIQYAAWIYLTPKRDITQLTQIVRDVGDGWETEDDSSRGKDGVFTLDLSVQPDTVRTKVWSPCYFVRKAGKDGLRVEEIEHLGTFSRKPWAE